MRSSDLKVNLIWLSDRIEPPKWSQGEVFICKDDPLALNQCLNEHIDQSLAQAWLFWDSSLLLPNVRILQRLLNSSADCWHVGLKLGMGGKPEWIDRVSPTWMLNRDLDPHIEATSWRLSLRACLVRSEVLDQLGGPMPNFDSLAAAGLEMGYRFIRKGVFVRHIPELLDEKPALPVSAIPLIDQMRFIQAGFSQRWLAWAGVRTVISGTANPFELIKAFRSIRQEKPLPQRKPFKRVFNQEAKLNETEKVSVLIPTLRRYDYLRMLLEQLRPQTIPPYEIIIVDQTPEAERDQSLSQTFSDLPIRWMFLDQAGQCSSRNLGLREAKGEFILFLDDDDEIPPDLVEKHLAALHQFDCNITNGIAHEVGAGALPVDFTFQRHSNVFPTNNTMIRKQILTQSGLFDLAYDHGQRADHDLGMRLYLKGELLVLNPEIAVLHHHAPTGGLREHKARINTYAASRQQLFIRNLPTVSDIYLAKRYFSDRQVREMLWISVLGTFSLKGSFLLRIMKVLVSFLCLPQTTWVLHQRKKKAEALLTRFPQIPTLDKADMS